MKWIAGIFLIIVSLPLAAEVVEVRLEPFPPLVREDGSGLVVDQLRELEQGSDLSFNIEIVSYSRAKYQLRNGQADLIGLIPLGRETDAFYGYARELNWRVETKADIFGTSRDPLEGDDWKEGRVGTPWGNADFFAQLTGVPRENFVESSLRNLVEMLSRGRVPVLLFERASTLTAIRELEDAHVHYRNVFTIPAGLAVERSERGDRLKTVFDRLLPRPADSPLFRGYQHYLRLPDNGRVSSDHEGPPLSCVEQWQSLCLQEESGD